MRFEAGATEVQFNVTAIPDGQLTGTRTGLLTASSGDLSTTLTVEILENLTDALVLSVPSNAVLREADVTGSVTATVRRLTANVEDSLTVTVEVVGSATAAGSVTIPAGETEATFAVRVVDDAVVNPGRTVRVTATADGFASAGTSVMVLDDEVSDFSLRLESPATVLRERFGRAVADFETTGLLAEAEFDNDASGGVPGSGGAADGSFRVGGVEMENMFTQFDTFEAWTGFALSRVADSTTAGFGNQYAAFPGGGAGPGGDGQPGAGYAVASAFSPVTILGDTAIRSLRIANTTYAALSMRDGDGFAKQFGGPDGTDPDFYIVTIEGFDRDSADQTATGSIDVPLADFRFNDDSLDFIVDRWIDVDLSPLGGATGLRMSVSSSDVGDFGINTPAYFAIDDIVTQPVDPPMLLLTRAAEDLQSEITVSLSLPPGVAERLIVPAEVTFAAGQESLEVPIIPVNASVVGRSFETTLTASIAGGPSETLTLGIEEAQSPRLLVRSESIDAGVLTVGELAPARLHVRLADAPSGTVQVNVLRTLGDQREGLTSPFQTNHPGVFTFTPENYATEQVLELGLLKSADLEVADPTFAVLEFVVSESPDPLLYTLAGPSLVLRTAETPFTDLRLLDRQIELRLADRVSGSEFSPLVSPDGATGPIVLSDADETLRVDLGINLIPYGSTVVDAAGGTNTLVAEVPDGELRRSPVDLLSRVAGFSRVVFEGATEQLLLSTALLAEVGPLSMFVDSSGGGKPILVGGWTLASAEASESGVTHVLTFNDLTLRIATDTPFVNPLSATDVTGDGVTTARDALRIINAINSLPGGSDGTLPSDVTVADLAGGYLDVNGDGRVTAGDALMVINRLSADDPAGQPEPSRMDRPNRAIAVAWPQIDDAFDDEEDWWLSPPTFLPTSITEFAHV